MNSNLSKLQENWAKAVTYVRGNRGAMLGVAGLAVIIVVQLGILPVYKLNKSLTAQERIAGGQLEQISRLAGEYQKLRKEASGIGTKKGGVNLFSRLENITRKLNIGAKVDFMRPSSKKLDDGRTEEEVYVRFKSILQKNFVNFLYSAEVEGGVVSVKHLRIKKDKGGRFDVDVIFTKVDG